MVSQIVFFVSGKPAPAGSKRAFAVKAGGKPTGRVVVTDTSGAAGRDWRALVQDRAFEAMSDTGWHRADGPVHLVLEFQYARPKAHYNSAGNVKPAFLDAKPTVKPDLTKVTRAVEDALNGIAWKDDTQVVQQSLSKVYAEQWGVLVAIIKK